MISDTDIVCVGEGEDALLELIEVVNNGWRNPKIAGIWYRTATARENSWENRAAPVIEIINSSLKERQV